MQFLSSLLALQACDQNSLNESNVPTVTVSRSAFVIDNICLSTVWIQFLALEGLQNVSFIAQSECFVIIVIHEFVEIIFLSIFVCYHI